MGKRKVSNQSRVRSNKRSNKRSTKRKSTVKRTNTYRIKKSKKKTHRRKYNKSHKTFKGGEGISAGLVAAGVAGLGAMEIYRRRRRKNEVGEITGVGDIGDDHDDRDVSVRGNILRTPPAIPGSVQSISGEPKSISEKYKDLLLDESMDESMDRIWANYCPHYTTDEGYNIKVYEPRMGERWYKREHKVKSIEWCTRNRSIGWKYGITDTYFFDDGTIDTGADETLLVRDWSELEELDGIDQFPNYQILEDLLKRLNLATEQKRLYLTKGTILKSKNHNIHDNHIYLECYGIIWSPVENTWRVIYGKPPDEYLPRKSPNSSNYNIKLDHFNRQIFNIYNNYGVIESIAFKTLYETVGFSVNKGDYLFRDDKLIRINCIYWWIDQQEFFIEYFDFQACDSFNIKFDLKNISINNCIKIENKPKYKCFNTFKKTERQHLIKKTTTLKITKISYDLTTKQFQYTISIDVKSDGNTKSVTMLEDKLDAYITGSNYQP